MKDQENENDEKPDDEKPDDEKPDDEKPDDEKSEIKPKSLFGNMSGPEAWEKVERQRAQNRAGLRLLNKRDLEGQLRAKDRRAKAAAEEEAMLFEAEEGGLHHDHDEEILEARKAEQH